MCFEIMASMMDRTIDSILTALIAVVLIASAFIPIVITQVNNLLETYASDSNIGLYTGLITIVVVMTIIGIIVGVIKTYQYGGHEGDR